MEMDGRKHLPSSGGKRKWLLNPKITMVVKLSVKLTPKTHKVAWNEVQATAVNRAACRHSVEALYMPPQLLGATKHEVDR